jgi:hypothetical protein
MSNQAMSNETMSTEERDTARDAENYRLRQAQVMLDLFEEAHARKASTMEELRAWIIAQDQQDLQSTLDRRCA